MKKYIIVVSKRGRKRAVTIKKDSAEDARQHGEALMRNRLWTDVEVYENDCITPAMEDGYILDSAAHRKNTGEIVWKVYKLKPRP